MGPYGSIYIYIYIYIYYSFCWSVLRNAILGSLCAKQGLAALSFALGGAREDSSLASVGKVLDCSTGGDGNDDDDALRDGDATGSKDPANADDDAANNGLLGLTVLNDASVSAALVVAAKASSVRPRGVDLAELLNKGAADSSHPLNLFVIDHPVPKNARSYFLQILVLCQEDLEVEIVAMDVCGTADDKLSSLRPIVECVLGVVARFVEPMHPKEWFLIFCCADFMGVTP
jgi:hypothetical protein